MACQKIHFRTKISQALGEKVLYQNLKAKVKDSSPAFSLSEAQLQFSDKDPFQESYGML